MITFLAMIPERVRRDLERRRSSAAGFHRNRDGADWLADYEAEIDYLEPGELEGPYA